MAGILLVGSGCSYRAWYEGFRGGRRQECSRLVNQSEREKCVQEMNGMEYDRYERKRSEAIGAGEPDHVGRPADIH